MLDERWRFRRDKLAWRIIGDEGVVLDLRSNHIYFLNRTAAALWEHLGDGATREGLADELHRWFGPSAGHALDDVAAWLEALERADLLEPATDPVAAEQPAAPALFGESYVAPEVSKQDVAFFSALGCGKTSPTTFECTRALRDS